MRLIQFFLLGLLSVTAYAEPIPPHLGEWSFTDYMSYFQSNANYTSAGTSTTGLPSGTFSTLQDLASVNYDAFQNLRFDANIGYGYSSATDNGTAISGSGFTEISLGAQYWWKHQDWALVPSLQFGYPFYRVNVNNPPTSSSLISNAAAWAEAGSWAIFYFHPWAAYAYLGFRYQDGGQAGLMPLEIGGSYRFAQARLRFGIRGEATVVNDAYTNNPGLRLNTPNTVDGGSLKFYSLNPTEFEGYSEFDWIFSRQWEAGAGISQTFYGSNAASGWTALAMVRFRIPGAHSMRQAPRPQVGQPTFQDQNVNYDEKLFEQANPDVKPSRKRPKLRKKPKSIDKMMKDTEKSLERQSPD